MIHYESNGGTLIQPGDELPNLAGASRVYVDTETTSKDPKKDSLDVWHSCDVAGIAITVDDNPRSWYVPVDHYADIFGNANCDRDGVHNWLRDIFSACNLWVNHNVKYDMHALRNSLGVSPPSNVRCTVVQAKLLDSDMQMRGGYGLDNLSAKWLGENIKPFEDRLKPYLKNNKDYGRIPPDIIGEYACQDVLTGRRLDKYIAANLPSESAEISGIENGVTSVLYSMEQEGFNVNPTKLRVLLLHTLQQMQTLQGKLTAIAGREFRPHVNGDCFDVICNQFGAPILAYTEDKDGEPTANPSFDKHALKLYSAVDGLPAGLVSGIAEYRGLANFSGLFLESFLRENINGVIHPDYNQAVRTGRFSCKRPNATNLSKAAKMLVEPPEGFVFLSFDYSQIEFRVIAHYIDEPEIVRAYLANPDTDFHQWVADAAGISRKPAKTLNFGMGYGQGRTGVIDSLTLSPEVRAHLIPLVDAAIERGQIPPDLRTACIDAAAKRSADKMYDTYHQKLPRLKPTAKLCENTCRSRGYVRNWYGRQRKLPQHAAFKAFNSVCQSTAADIMKDRMVAVAAGVCGPDVRLLLNVHDELLFAVRRDVLSVDLVGEIIQIMESPLRPLKVPIRCSAGWSAENWAAAGDSKLWNFETHAALQSFCASL